eukprot:NODE_345_length_9042_cov_0.258973.p2 type:complete len:337 gc:universal NODE_345_length_9042_cov_0.258973:5611-6621(+)
MNLLCFLLAIIQASYILNDVTYELKQEGSNLIVTMTSLMDGWVGFGVGRNMKGDVVVAWKNAGKVIVSNRISSSEDLPAFEANSNLKVISSSVTDAGFTVQFSRPLAASSGFKTAASTEYMAAYKQGAIPSSDPKYSFEQHDYKQNFLYNLATGQASGSAVTSQMAHGVLMTWSWLVLMPISILIARFGKKRLGAKWFHLHRIINGTVMLATIIALILILVAYDNQVYSKNNVAHPTIGSILFGLMFIQVGIGIYINKKFNPSRTKVPNRDKSHWIVGYILLILGFVNAILGYTLVSSSAAYVFTAVAIFILCLFVFIVLQIRMGQIHDHGYASSS